MLGIDPHGNEIDYPEKKKGAARSVKDPIHDMNSRTIYRPDCSWKHEDASVMMFDALVEENPERINLSDEDKLFIKALIAGTPKSCPDEKSFLFDIVSNQRNGIDVDK
ncbi:hypothetical protein C0991_010333 [Blastosporella zonata]|nr:hypothetical protein C0991_010333 [Blastosporella zonata]